MKQTLSPIELSFWYQYKFDPRSDANNIVHRLTVAMSLDKTTLERIIGQLISKHPVLHSSFQEEDGVPFRILNRASTLDLTDGEKMTEETILNNIKRPFVLEQGPLLRVIFVRHKDSTTLFMACPHIVFDAMSWNIFLDDFTAALNDNHVGDTYSLGKVNIDTQAQQYWTSRLDGVEGRVSFERNPALQANSGTLGLYERPDADSLFEKLIVFGKSEGFSMNSLCMALLAVTLYKTTDSKRMIIATPVTTRDENSATHVGPYINVLPTVLDVDGDKTFLDYAKDVSNQLWEDIDNRNFSLIKLLGELPSRYRDDSQGIYNVMAEYVPNNSRNGIIREDELIPNTSVKLDLTLSVLAGPKGHKISIEYDASKLESSYIAQLVEVFMSITSSILKESNRLIRNIPIVGDVVAQKLLQIGSGPTREMKPPFVWNRFKAMAKSYSDHVAIKDDNGEVSYRELFKMSCRYANLLSGCGVGKDSVVGVYMERSADYVASMLAIWSLGAIYVPLDISQPSRRIEFMIEQAGITAVITRGKSGLTETVLQCDITNSSNTKLYDSDYEPDNRDTSYIIFTSGSTGTPKGVMIEHRGFLNHLEIMIHDLNLTDTDVVAQTAPVSFDISVWQLVCALMVGASIRIVDHDDLIDADQMYKIINADNISVMEVVPSLLSGYLMAEDANDNLRYVLKGMKVITTGEAISGLVAKQWTTHYPEQSLLNAYGPAEASDDTHFFDILPSTIEEVRPIPIGQPLLNIRTYVVNQDLQLCPEGMTGEICIGGIAVAKGYVGNSDLTAKAFLLDPFVTEQGARLYRTGDYGRWRDDGLLEYHGRRDHQVKIRGQRLELGEVEDRLKVVPGVKDAAVIADKTPNDTRLIGYIAPVSTSTDIDKIKAGLRSMLPDFMVPQKLVLVSDLPKTRNGKLDRKALEGYSEDDQSVDKRESVNSALLSEIIQVYSHVLGAEISADSNYFDCRGDSLQSMKIVALLEKRGIYAGVRDILMHQTPKELSESIEKKRADRMAATEEWPILSGLTPIQQHYLEYAGGEHVDSGEIQAAILTLAGDKRLDGATLQSALREVMLSHAELRPTKMNSPLILETPRTYDISSLIADARSKITLDNPLVGYVLHSNDRPKILLVAHHFVFDFYSWGIILSDLNDTLEGRLIPKEDLLKRWWGKALSNVKSGTLELDEIKRFWEQSSYDGQLKAEVTSDSTKNLEYAYYLPGASVARLARGGVSLENLVYYALAKAYMTVFGQSVFACNIEASLRSIDDASVLSRGVGWMTYLFPVRVESDVTLVDFCKTISETARRGYEYGLLRYTVCPELFKGASDSPWTINYIGKNVNGTDDIEIIKKLPEKVKPFIEIDVRYVESNLIVEFCHNTTLTKVYFDSLHEELKKNIKAATDHIGNSKRKFMINTERKEAILKRLKNAG